MYYEENFWSNYGNNLCNMHNGGVQPLISDISVSAVVSDYKLYDGYYLEYIKYDEDGDGTYDYIEITDCDNSVDNSATEIEIPGEIDGVKVTVIRSNAFSGCTNLTSVNILDGVTSIDFCAFDCTSLTSINIPKSVTYIDGSAFLDCTNLSDIEVAAENEKYSSIDGVLFNKDKTELIEYPIGNPRTEYNIPDSVTSIAYRAFAYCESLSNVSIPESVISIETDAFKLCTNLTSINIPDSVTDIGWDVFEGTALTKSQTGVKYADTWVVDCDEDVITAEIKDGTRGIADYAFRLCENLESINIPDGLTSIGWAAFDHCTSLVNINIPDGVTYIGAFNNCTSLTNIDIPDSVTSIGSNAFYFCKSLTSIDIPDSVTSIGSYAFHDCTRLTNIKIPNSVTYIDSKAFEECTSLTNVNIPNSVTNIEEGAFIHCTDLESIIIRNPDCVIYDDKKTISNGYDSEKGGYYFTGTIYGHENSEAQDYAEKCSYEFKIIGDLNGDGTVSSADAVLMNEFLTNSEISQDIPTAVADMNGDGVINVFDLIILKRYLLS